MKTKKRKQFKNVRLKAAEKNHGPEQPSSSARISLFHRLVLIEGIVGALMFLDEVVHCPREQCVKQRRADDHHKHELRAWKPSQGLLRPSDDRVNRKLERVDDNGRGKQLL